MIFSSAKAKVAFSSAFSLANVIFTGGVCRLASESLGKSDCFVHNYQGTNEESKGKRAYYLDWIMIVIVVLPYSASSMNIHFRSFLPFLPVPSPYQ